MRESEEIPTTLKGVMFSKISINLITFIDINNGQ